MLVRLYGAEEEAQAAYEAGEHHHALHRRGRHRRPLCGLAV